MYVCMYVCMYVYIYIHVHTYTQFFMTSALVAGGWGKLHAPATLPRGEEADWTPEPLRTTWGRGKNSLQYRDSNSKPSAIQPVGSRHTNWPVPAPTFTNYLPKHQTTWTHLSGKQHKWNCIRTSRQYEQSGKGQLCFRCSHVSFEAIKVMTNIWGGDYHLVVRERSLPNCNVALRGTKFRFRSPVQKCSIRYERRLPVHMIPSAFIPGIYCEWTEFKYRNLRLLLWTH
jgi:hypothetical protein